MKKFMAGLGWLLLFIVLGAVIMLGLAMALLPHRVPLALWPGIAGTGVMPALLAWVIAVVFAALPGVRRAPGGLGLAQGLWAMIGAGLMLMCGGMLPYIAALYVMLVRILRHLPHHLPDVRDPYLLVAMFLAGELLCGLWLLWYARRQGPAVVADGSAAGIGWRAAPPAAYAAAGLGMLVLLAFSSGEIALFPPDQSKVAGLTLSQLMSGPRIVVYITVAVGSGLAPVIEEFLFRGVAFAGIAARLGAGWAVVITTLVFTAVHAPEKMMYLPGFANVALLALLSCGLRLRYRSIRPGIVMHFLYNFGILALPLLTGGR
jgi:membrane protease YdiL (CAAX protease family)